MNRQLGVSWGKPLEGPRGKRISLPPGVKVTSPKTPAHGPGTELKKLLTELGINPRMCNSKGRAAQMDAWGATGCRANRETIVGWLREEQGNRGWREKLAAAALAVLSGLAFRLDVLDPIPSLVDEAIRRADQQPDADDGGKRERPQRGWTRRQGQ